MKRKIKLSIVLLLIIGGVIIWKFPHESRPHVPVIPARHCNDVHSPCYKVTMPGQPDLYINGWHHYGDSDCIDFTSLPDGDFHGYCGIYKVKRLH